MTHEAGVVDAWAGPFAAAYLAMCAWCPPYDADPPEGFNIIGGPNVSRDPLELIARLVEHLETVHEVVDPWIVDPFELMKEVGLEEQLRASGWHGPPELDTQ